VLRNKATTIAMSNVRE